MPPQTGRSIYLPPGTVVPPQVIVPATNPGIPFDRPFFEQILPKAIESFCQQVECKVPVVELLTVDGTTHYVNAISGVSDLWVALQTTQVDHDHPTQVFVPYQTIFRVEIHPAENERRQRLGFLPAPKPAPRTNRRAPAAAAAPPIAAPGP
jgi:hypothetical protein